MSADAEAKIGELRSARAVSLRAAPQCDVTVTREDLVPSDYRDHAHEEIPLPLPGERATISCPQSYLAVYVPHGLGKRPPLPRGWRGVGLGTAPAPELVGREGLVVPSDLDAATLGFARENLDRCGYTDVVLVHGGTHFILSIPETAWQAACGGHRPRGAVPVATKLGRRTGRHAHDPRDRDNAS